MQIKTINFSTGYGLDYIIKLNYKEEPTVIDFKVADENNELFISGHIKFDGCINFDRAATKEGVMYHNCGILDYLNESKVITEVYRQCWVILSDEYNESNLESEFIVKRG